MKCEAVKLLTGTPGCSYSMLQILNFFPVCFLGSVQNIVSNTEWGNYFDPWDYLGLKSQIKKSAMELDDLMNQPFIKHLLTGRQDSEACFQPCP